jgi:hypothetical protein
VLLKNVLGAFVLVVEDGLCGGAFGKCNGNWCNANALGYLMMNKFHCMNV